MKGRGNRHYRLTRSSILYKPVEKGHCLVFVLYSRQVTVTKYLMGKHKGFVKGLAAGAVLGAVASVLMSMEHKDEKKAALARVAKRVKTRVVQHSKNIGKLTKSAYNQIVDTTIAEFRGVKDLSEDEMKELRAELRDSWSDVKGVVEPKKSPAKKSAKKTKKRK